jgi:hypothetical protein
MGQRGKSGRVPPCMRIWWFRKLSAIVVWSERSEPSSDSEWA